ncbi:MAG: ABC transporter permease [Coprococcus sp.]
MRKLLSASFSRLWKDKLFWIMTAAMFIFSLITMLSSAHSANVMSQSGYVRTLDDYFFNLAPLMGLFDAIFISMFLGTEYADGTMRNKLIVGHTRRHIYLTNFIVCFTAGLCFIAAWLLGEIPGFFLIGPLEMGIPGFLVYLLVAAGFTAALSAIFTFVGTMTDNKALTVVLTLTVWLGILLASSALYDRLCEPEMESGVMLTANGMEIQDPTPNPMYLSGTKRTVCECLLEFLPTGQTILMSDTAIEHPLRQSLFSITITAGTTLAGFAAFHKKNIR